MSDVKSNMSGQKAEQSISAAASPCRSRWHQTASLPSGPLPKTLNKKQMRHYRGGRDALVRAVATRIGRSGLMIDL